MSYYLLLLIILLLLLLTLKDNIKRLIRIANLYSKLPGPSYFQVLTIPYRLSRLKETDILDYLHELMNNRKKSSFLAVTICVTFLTDPIDLERALSSTRHITKGYEYEPLKLWLKEGLLTSTGTKWHERRKILTPTFHFKILDDALPVINEHAVKLAKKFLSFNNDSVVIEKFVTNCTLDIICETAMGTKLNPQEEETVTYAKDIKRFSQLMIRFLTSAWLWYKIIFRFSSTLREMLEVTSRLQNFTNKMINERKQSFQSIQEIQNVKKNKKRMVFIDSLLDQDYNRLKGTGSLSDDDIQEEVDTFLFEGHDTTSAAIGFCLMSLGQNQHVQELVAKELEDIFGNSDRAVTRADLQKMKYLEMVIKETLRLYPSVPIITRVLDNDLELADGKIVPECTTLFLLPYLVHRDPSIYEEPEKFIPERFNEENIKARHPFSYIPFSAGPRNCIGQKFAMMEIKVVISTIVRNCKLESITKIENLKLKPLLILRPDVPIQIRFTPRII